MGKAMKTEKGRRAIGAVKNTVIVVCLATVIISATFFAVRSILKAEFPMKYQDKISLYAETYGVPEDLLYGVIHTESGYDEKAKSHAGAIGLTQITPETFLWLQTKTGETLPEEALYDADTSVKYCAVFYGLLLKEFGGDEKNRNCGISRRARSGKRVASRPRYFTRRQNSREHTRERDKKICRKGPKGCFDI